MDPTANVHSEKADSVTFMSYNPTGLNSTVKCRFVSDICDEHDVDFISIQEHFKFVSTTDQYFKKKFSDFYSYITPGYRAPGQDYGRAKAGLAQLTRKQLKVKKERVETAGFRIQAQILHLPSTRVLWINTYLPTDPQTIRQYDDEELQGVLTAVESLLATCTYDDVVWGSDLNWDMARRTFFARNMKSFVEKLGLEPLWHHHPVPYTHVHTDNKSKSSIDHFLLSPRLIPLVADCGIVERGDNLSRHCPIYVKLNLGSLPLRQSIRQWVPKRPCWSKATQADIDSYTAALQSSLLEVSMPDSVWCADPHCNNHMHSQERDILVLELLDTMV